MPKDGPHGPHYRVPLNMPLVQAVGRLGATAKTSIPALWVIWNGKHKTPYSQPPNVKPLHWVRLDDGSAEGEWALRVDTACSTYCEGDGYLVSDGFQSCVAVIGVSPTRTYLAHVNTLFSLKTGELFREWEPGVKVMIVRTNGANPHKEIVAKLLQIFSGARGSSFCLDVTWGSNVAVVVYRSTCIVYQENPLEAGDAAIDMTAAWRLKAGDTKSGDTKAGDTRFGSAAAGPANTFTIPGAATTAAAAAAAAGGGGGGAVMSATTASVLPPNTKSNSS